jgi:hypothetical protein
MKQSIGLNLSGLQKFNDFFNEFALETEDKQAILRNLSAVLRACVPVGEPYYYVMRSRHDGKDATLTLNRDDISIVAVPNDY